MKAEAQKVKLRGRERVWKENRKKKRRLCWGMIKEITMKKEGMADTVVLGKGLKRKIKRERSRSLSHLGTKSQKTYFT